MMNESNKDVNSSKILTIKPLPTLIWGRDFIAKPPRSTAIIRGILNADSLSYFYGDSESGKSFLALDLALHIAHGLPWRGRKTKQGFVLYIIGEGENGMKKRVKRWHEFHDLPMTDEILFRTIPLQTGTKEAVAEFVAEIKQAINILQRNPILIELDTINRNFGPGDENSTKDMTAFVNGMTDLRLATGAAISGIHHCSKGDKTQGRGSIVLYNSVDFCYSITKTGEDVNSWVTTLKCEKIKDDVPCQPLSWTWQRREILHPDWKELDDDDHLVPMTSCVLIPTDYQEKTSRIGDKQQKSLELLKRLYKEHQDNLAAGGIDPATAQVRKTDWNNKMRDIEPDKGNRSHIRSMLIKRKLVIELGDYVKPA
jgi:hypothetical protein